MIMKKNALLMFAIAITAMSCNKTQKEIIQTYADGKPQLVYEVMMVDGEKQRLSEEMFYNSGATRYLHIYKDNQPFGIWKFYYESGKLFAEADFSKSRIGDNWVFYYENGDRIYDEKDEITILEITKDRCPITVEFGDDFDKKQCQFYSDFGLRCEGNLKNNNREGLWTFYFENGNKQAEGHYVENIQDGEHVVYHENGNVYYKGCYEKGKRVGLWGFFDEEGRKIATKEFGENNKNTENK